MRGPIVARSAVTRSMDRHGAAELRPFVRGSSGPSGWGGGSRLHSLHTTHGRADAEAGRPTLLLRARRRLLLHQVLVVPRKVAFEAITLVARSRDAVALVRIDHELRVDAEAAQRLVH